MAMAGWRCSWFWCSSSWRCAEAERRSSKNRFTTFTRFSIRLTRSCSETTGPRERPALSSTVSAARSGQVYP
jgi:hypothetical protein